MPGYNPHTWVDNEAISDTRLNAIEQGIATATSQTGATAIAYDAFGRISSITNGSDVTTLTYGSHGQLVAVSNGTTTISVTRDAKGRISALSEA